MPSLPVSPYVLTILLLIGSNTFMTTTQVQKRLNNYNGARRHFHLYPLVAARRREVKRCGRINFIRATG
jgi:hypothetical protein